MQKTLIPCLMGPTATGKTDIAVELIQHFPIEIISIDSAMIYRGLDIGTAKPTQDILTIAPHHLIDIRDPSETYSAGDFHKEIQLLIANILQRNHIPLLVGGTMLYFHVLQHGLANLPSADTAIRKQLSHQLEQEGLESLYQQLQKLDPQAAQRISPNDPQRIQRALEVFYITGKPISEIQHQTQTDNPYQFNNIALLPADKMQHWDIMEQRLVSMLKNGFIEEVEALLKRGDLNPDLPALRSVGYRQIWDYLTGKLSYDEMAERANIATRQLAKRQMTWLRKWDNLSVVYSDETTKFEKIRNLIATKNTT